MQNAEVLGTLRGYLPKSLGIVPIVEPEVLLDGDHPLIAALK